MGMDRAGWIEVICGCMFSGKTEELIHRVQSTKQNAIVFKPMLDDRYSKDEVVSHNGTAIKALPVASPLAMLDYIHADIHIVAVDEAQFFDETIISVVKQLANQGCRVIISGLDQDFRGEPFSPMPELMAVAEEVTKLKAICAVCDAPATRTQRLVNGKPAHAEDPIILVGASEAYEARCRKHHEVPSLSAYPLKEN